MLGALETDCHIKKVTTENIKLMGNNVLLVKIPAEKKRYLKRAGKMLKNKMVIVAENSDEEMLANFGIQVISPRKLYKYIADKIFVETIERFDLTDKAKTAIYAGRISENEKGILRKISEKSRLVSISAPNREAAANWLMENCGISAVRSGKETNVFIEIYDSNFSLYCFCDSVRHELQKVSIEADLGSILPETHAKSACVALISMGRLTARDINIKNLEFKCEINLTENA